MLLDVVFIFRTYSKMVKEDKPKKVIQKKPRADKTKVKARNVWKVAEIKVKDPNATYRDIQKKTWLSPSTISKATEELKQNWTKDTTISYIVGSAKIRLQRISLLKDRYVDQLDIAEEIGNREIDMANKLWQEDMKLVTVLWGDITKPDWWLKEVIDDERLKAIESLNKMFTK